MDAFALNSATVNSVGSYASVVLLPTSTATVDLALYERIAVSMEGTAGFSLDLVGNIARVSNLGNAPVASTFAVAGDLTQYRTISLGEAEVSISFEMNGEATTVILGPSGVSSFGWEPSGELTKIGFMAGESSLVWEPEGSVVITKLLGDQSFTSAFNVSGDVIRTQHLTGELISEFSSESDLSIGSRNYFPVSTLDSGWEPSGLLSLVGGLEGVTTSGWTTEGALTIGYRVALPAGAVSHGFTVEGALRSTQRFSGDMVQGFDASGSLVNVRPLQGAVNVSTAVQGTLANNASGYDLKTVLMIRPESQREMIR